jgi:hypothetical protein
MVTKKKGTAKSKATKATAARTARRSAASGLIDCMQIETSRTRLCITSRCRESCRVEIRIVCGGRISREECRWDGRQWVCTGDQGHVGGNE